MVFQEATSEPDEKRKQRNRQHVIWCLTTNTRANRVAIVSFVITKIFNPCTHWAVMIQPSVLFMFRESVWLCSLPVSFIVHQYCLTLIQLCPVLFGLLVLDYLYTQCYILSWHWNCIPDILIPISTTIQQVNKHHTLESTIFCLSIESESLLPP
jgi:hypothetical protein